MKKYFLRALLPFLVVLWAPQASAGVAIEQWTTTTGARVFYVATHNLPMLDLRVDFPAGSLYDPPGKAGLAALTRSVLDLGAGRDDEAQVARRLADVGAQLAGGADMDRAGVTLRTLSDPDKREPALAVLLAILHQPRFDAAIVQREQMRTVASLRESLTRPDTQAGRAFWPAMYGDHPYGRQATPETLASLRRADLVDFYQRQYRAGGAVISLVGDIDRETAGELAERLAAGLPRGAAPELPAPPQLPERREVRIAHPASQAHIYLGLPALVRGDPDFFPLLVGNYTLGGGGFVSRLMIEVREKRGYAYSVGSYFEPMQQMGPFQISLQTKKTQAEDALALSRRLLDDFLRNGPSEVELKEAKDNLVGSFPLRLDNNRKILDNLAMIGFYGLPLDWLDRYQARVAAVTREDVRAAFARHVQLEHLITVVVGGP